MACIRDATTIPRPFRTLDRRCGHERARTRFGDEAGTNGAGTRRKWNGLFGKAMGITTARGGNWDSGAPAPRADLRHDLEVRAGKSE
jgi:hypothetical protein